MKIELDDLQKDAVRKFVDNDLMRETVKQFLLSDFREPIDWGANLNNEEVGANERAKHEAVLQVTKAFNHLNQYRTPIESVPAVNPAR